MRVEDQIVGHGGSLTRERGCSGRAIYSINARAVGNLVGNCVAAVVIAAWEKHLDLERAKAVLASGDGEMEVETATA
jgi:Na+/H+-dicarboxylate symporter